MFTTAIVILNWNGRSFLEKYLETLIERSLLPGVTIVIADNGSTDGSQQWLKDNYSNKISLIEFDVNYGYTGGYNKALKEVEADYYILLNSDIEVCEGWLEPLLEAMEGCREIGVCMPKIKAADDRAHFEYAGASGGFIDFLGYPFCRGRVLSNIEEDSGQYNSNLEIFWASGAAFVVRASLFHSLGGFDDNFFAHMEEIDFCWRAKREGWQVWVFPSSQVYHVGGGTLPNNSPQKLYLNYRNNLLMLYKNLPYRYMWGVLGLRLALDKISALLYLLQGKHEFYKSVNRAHRSFWEMKSKMERDNIDSYVSRVYRGSIVLSFFASGKRFKFSDTDNKFTGEPPAPSPI